MTNTWMAGAARAPFWFPPGLPMAGYADRDGPATGILDKLTIGALVLQFEQQRFVLVAADIVAVDSALVDEIALASGLQRSELAVCASHTHSGPAGVIRRLHPSDPDESIPDVRNTFVQVCKNAITLAQARVEPVELRFGQTTTHGLAANRNDPAGPFDPRVSVLTTQNQAGYLTAVLVHFACHPTILSAANRAISADFPGAIRKWTEQAVNQNRMPPVVLFANGAAGDISTRFTRRAQDAEEVTRIGREIGIAAQKALYETVDVGPGMASASIGIELEGRVFDGVSQPELDTADGTHLNEAERRKAATRAQGAMLLEHLSRTDPHLIPHSAEIRAWRLGGLELVAIPGELFASLGERIVQAAPGPALVLGYANGYVGYLVDEVAEAAGTYEALASPFAPGAGEATAQAAIAAILQAADR